MAQSSARSERAPRAMTNPGVRIPPPAVYILTLVIGWLLQSRWPLPFIAHDVALLSGLPLVAIGLALATASIVTMLRGHGTVNTNSQSSALVVSGIYRISRNPMYVALTIMYIGFALAIGLPWALILLPLLLVYVRTMVIAREEKSLANAFGQQYLDYKARVRRWL